MISPPNNYNNNGLYLFRKKAFTCTISLAIASIYTLCNHSQTEPSKSKETLFTTDINTTSLSPSQTKFRASSNSIFCLNGTNGQVSTNDEHIERKQTPSNSDRVVFKDSPTFCITSLLIGTFASLQHQNPIPFSISLLSCIPGAFGLPLSPQLVSSYVTNGPAWSVTIHRNMAFVSNGDLGLDIINISNTTSPKNVSKYLKGHTYQSVALENTIYVACGNQGLRILDISKPNILEYLGFYNAAGHKLTTLAVSNGIAYLGYTYTYLQIINVTNPSNPQKIGFFPVDHLKSIIYSNRTVYALSNLLDIINVSSSGQPKRLGQYTDLINPQGMYIEEPTNRIYIADSSSLQILDANNVSSIKRIGQFHSEQSINSLVVKDNLAFLSDGLSGLQILDVTNPTSISYLGNFNVNKRAQNVALFNNLIFLTLNQGWNHQSGELKIINWNVSLKTTHSSTTTFQAYPSTPSVSTLSSTMQPPPGITLSRPSTFSPVIFSTPTESNHSNTEHNSTSFHSISNSLKELPLTTDHSSTIIWIILPLIGSSILLTVIIIWLKKRNPPSNDNPSNLINLRTIESLNGNIQSLSTQLINQGAHSHRNNITTSISAPPPNVSQSSTSDRSAQNITPTESIQQQRVDNPLNSQENVRGYSNSSDPPQRFLCSITTDIMLDPVQCSEGHNFDRTAISRWLAINSTCPIDRKPLPTQALVPNRALKEEIEEWLVRNPQNQ